MTLFYPVMVIKLPADDGSGYLAYAPDLKGCMSDGETPEEAFKNGRQAIKEWMENATRSPYVVIGGEREPAVAMSIKLLREMLDESDDDATVYILAAEEHHSRGLGIFNAKGDCERIIHVPFGEGI